MTTPIQPSQTPTTHDANTGVLSGVPYRWVPDYPQLNSQQYSGRSESTCCRVARNDNHAVDIFCAVQLREPCRTQTIAVHSKASCVPRIPVSTLTRCLGKSQPPTPPPLATASFIETPPPLGFVKNKQVTVTVCSPAAEAAAQPAPDKAENNDPDTTSTAPAIASDPPPGKEASGVEPPPPTPSKKSGEEEEEEKNPSSSADASDARGAGPGTKDAPNGGEGVGGPSGEGGGSIGDDGDGPAGDAMVRAGSAIGEEEEEMAVCITVYPPQRSGAAPLMLEPLAGVELVMQIRQLLGEVPQTCLYSAFRLVAVAPRGGGGGGDQEDVWKREGEVMNDYVELRSIAAIAARPEKVQVRK